MKIKTEIEMTPEEAKELITPDKKDIDRSTELYYHWLETVQKSAQQFWTGALNSEAKNNDRQG